MLLAIKFALALILLAFLPTISSFPATWAANRSHGFAIAAFCVWLILRERKQLVRADDALAPALLGAASMSVAWLLAMVMGVRVGHQAAFVVVLVAWTGALFGRMGAKYALSIAVIFSLALPIWEVLLGPLQTMTVAVNHALVALTGLPARVDGSSIHFPFGVIEVAESCAGLSYFMSALTISVIYARLFLRRTETRIIAIAMAVALALVSNWLRVFGLVLIGHYSKMQSPLMTEHAVYGWVIFAVVLSVFFIFSGRLERWERRSAEKTARVTDLATAPTSSAMPNTAARLWGATLAAVLGPALLLFVSALPSAAAAGATPGLRPGSTWTRESIREPGRWSPRYLQPSERREEYWARGDQRLQVDRFLYATTVQGAELIGGDNRIADRDSILAERMVGPLDRNVRIVREAIVRTPRGVRVVWYWYWVAGIETSSPTKAKLLEIVRFIARGGPSELVAVSAACAPTDCREANQLLFDFVTGGTAMP